MSKIYFDVGANNGDSCIQYLNGNNIVYGFEPTPKMIDIIKNKVGNNPNYRLIPVAVSDVEGKAKFKISGQADWGCSSLCYFNDNLNETWPGRNDFKITEEIEVDVVRLDSFVEKEGITEIEFLHVDVQGKDLEVLMGLGSKINIVKAGVIEMPTSHKTKLYKDQKYLENDAIEFLNKNGFNVDKVEANDCFRNEVNIYFSRTKL
jgi:FkbM family methyltransferase